MGSSDSTLFGGKFPNLVCQFEDDGHPTKTSHDQRRVERDVAKYLAPLTRYTQEQIAEMADYGWLDATTGKPRLLRRKHAAYCRRGLEGLSASYACLDASRPWLLYWMIHALELLDALPDKECLSRCVGTLKKCAHLDGGFGGGPHQLAHTAPTYAAVLALFTIGTEEAYESIDRRAMYRFFMRCKDPDTGCFRVEGNDGEMDARGLYTVMAVASMLNILTPELKRGAAEFVARCQTFEGGLGGYPGNEAHGGYSFCAFAALVILERTDIIDTEAFARWICAKQMRCEGGYQGRTNKLVDACYSFWQGAIPLLLKRAGVCREALQDTARLQEYILLACQQKEGGLRDKPGKPRDYYHTCYALSGLSVAQHSISSEMPLVWGSDDNVVVETDPVYNVSCRKLAKGMEYFAKCGPLTHEEAYLM